MNILKRVNQIIHLLRNSYNCYWDIMYISAVPRSEEGINGGITLPPNNLTPIC